MNEKIAIYWWAFNPPTLWHLHVIKEIFNNTDIKKIIITPDWLRLDKDYKISEFHRSNLLKIFVDELKNKWYNIEIEDYFLKWKNNSDTTTYEVDKYFIKKLWFQPYHIFWTDILNWIENWSWNPNQYIERRLKKIFISRKWYIFNKKNLENYKLIDSVNQYDISSTETKENINKNLKIDTLVLKQIEDYINNNNLY